MAEETHEDSTQQNAQPPPASASESKGPAKQARGHTVTSTRTSGMWTAVVLAAVVLLVLLIFILQNLDPATVTFFGLAAQIPLGIALLLAAVAGALLVVASGIARILQLRRLARHHRRIDRKGSA